MGELGTGSPRSAERHTTDVCRILSLDGGGAKGFYTLGVLKEIEGTPFRSAEEIREEQFRDLSSLLAHAEAHVPYYRALFRRLGIRSQDIRNWDDFVKLPVLTKDIIREKQLDLVREDVPLEKLRPHFSGGSTGVPLKLMVTESKVPSVARVDGNVIVITFELKV